MYGALAANRPFLAEANGFAGTGSDGLSQLDASRRLVKQYESATDGNVTQTALVNAKPGQPFTLALGFGPSAQMAIGAARHSASRSFGATAARYTRGWRGYDRGLRRPPTRIGGFTTAQDNTMHRAYWLSANLAQLTALVKSWLRRMQYRPGLLDGFLASTGLDLTPFCNTHH